MNIDNLFTMYPYNLICAGAIVLSFLFSFIALSMAISAKRRISRLLNGKNSKDIDEVLIHIYKNISLLDQFKTKTQNDLLIVNDKLSRSIQSVETVRFNPFKGTGSGGNQSFATAFINEEGDGVVISSLYSSDRVSVFAKPITKLTSTYELTEEEVQAVHTAASRID